MPPGQATKTAVDLLGPAPRAVAPGQICAGIQPRLEIAWGSFHQGIASSVRAIFSRSGVRGKFSVDGFFKQCWVERRIPGRAVVAAALWHVVFLVMPIPRFPATARHFASFENVELTWSGPINDLPLVDLKSAKPRPAPRGERETLPRPGTEAFHPRQHIFTDSLHPTHPRQTLVNPAAPLEAPKILPNLPNFVQIQEFAGPTRPRLQISQETLVKLHPTRRPAVSVAPVPLAEAPTFDGKAGQMALLESPDSPTRPKLELNAGAAPRLGKKAQSGEAAPAPDLEAPPRGANTNSATLIAISAAPAPPTPVVQVPQGNLAAHVAISPEGKQPAAPGGSPTGTAASPEATASESGKNGVNVSIAGGSPPKNNGISTLPGAARISAPAPHALASRPDPGALVDDGPARSGPPNFATLPPGAQPEQIFASKRVYKLLVNMPNLNSATGSWILNFSELRLNSGVPQVATGDLSGPAPLRKVDPKYPPSLRNEHVEGEVVLYAVIRRDGSVDSIQLVHGIDELLDANAMEALSQWKFRPGTRGGAPVELEAIVHIPYHTPSDR